MLDEYEPMSYQQERQAIERRCLGVANRVAYSHREVTFGNVLEFVEGSGLAIIMDVDPCRFAAMIVQTVNANLHPIPCEND